MRSGPASPSPIVAARKAKLGFGLAGISGETGAGVRAELARRSAEEAVSTAARAGVTLFHAAEGSEGLMRSVGEGRFILHLKSHDLGPDQLEARLVLVRERMRSLRPITIMLGGARLLEPDGDALWRQAQHLREAGVIAGAGVTVAPGGDAMGLARRFKPELMQVFAGLLDQRLMIGGLLGEIAGMGIEVHLRTTLLHGLLFLPREGLPAAMAEAGPLVSRVRRAIAEAGADPLQAALAFALDRPEASGVVIEAGSAAEVRAILAAATAPSPHLDWPSLALDHPAALDAEAGLRRCAA